MMNIRWHDLRWQSASRQRIRTVCSLPGDACNATELETGIKWSDNQMMSAVFGQTASAFIESTTAYGGSLGLIMAGNVWTPIPPHLKLKTSSNPLGMTEFDPVIRMVDAESGLMDATWADRAKTVFDVSLSYTYYPFDEQTLDLCLPFDYFTDPEISDWGDGPGVKHEDEEIARDIQSLSVHWDAPASHAQFVSERFVSELESKGFTVDGIEIFADFNSEITSSVCIRIHIFRRITILVLRFFWPLTALLFIPFAGFFIPIEMVMPRVATGFISFLSLQVFRTMAYSLIPKPSSSLLWMDVTMFTMTVIMFASVLENVLAQAVRANVSSHAAKFVDNLSKVTFPVTGVTMLTVLFWMGAMNVATDWLMAVCIMILSFWLLSFNLAIFLYIRCLESTLMKTLVEQIAHPDFRYRGMKSLDQKELSIVFKAFDKDGTGDVTADEVLDCFGDHGLSFKREDDETHFRIRLRDMFQKKGKNNRLDLNGFCFHFAELFRYHSPQTEDEEEQDQKAFGGTTWI